MHVFVEELLVRRARKSARGDAVVCITRELQAKLRDRRFLGEHDYITHLLVCDEAGGSGCRCQGLSRPCTVNREKAAIEQEKARDSFLFGAELERVAL